jgi:hypothetical protein
MKMKKELFSAASILLFLYYFIGCTTSAIFNQRAYEQDVSTKVDALALMDKADQPYIQHADEIGQLELNIEKAYQYAKGLPNNDETVAQWEIIKDTTKNSLFGFLKRWKEENKLNRAFIEGAKKNVSDGFDQVIELESGKRK